MRRFNIRSLPGAVLLALASLLVLGTACDDEEGAEGEPQAGEIYEVTVEDDAVSPQDLALRYPGRATIVVNNESDEHCLFNLLPFVRELAVPPGDSTTMSFTMFEPSPEDVGGAEGEQLSMGCEGGPTTTVEVLEGTSRLDDPGP